MNSYTRFVGMVAVSTIVMFALMYLNTYQLDHVYLSETRAFMALIMGAAMAVTRRRSIAVAWLTPPHCYQPHWPLT